MKPRRQVNRWPNLWQVNLLLLILLLRCLHLTRISCDLRWLTHRQRLMSYARLDRPTNRRFNPQERRALFIDRSVYIALLDENLSWDALTRCGFCGHFRNLFFRGVLFCVVIGVFGFALAWNAAVMYGFFWLGNCQDCWLLAKLCKWTNFYLFFLPVICNRFFILGLYCYYRFLFLDFWELGHLEFRDILWKIFDRNIILGILECHYLIKDRCIGFI